MSPKCSGAARAARSSSSAFARRRSCASFFSGVCCISCVAMIASPAALKPRSASPAFFHLLAFGGGACVSSMLLGALGFPHTNAVATTDSARTQCPHGICAVQERLGVINRTDRTLDQNFVVQAVRDPTCSHAHKKMTISSSQKISDFVEMKSSFFCFQRLDFKSQILSHSCLSYTILSSRGAAAARAARAAAPIAKQT